MIFFGLFILISLYEKRYNAFRFIYYKIDLLFYFNTSNYTWINQ
jgi:hypothetical protein